jgi:predicted dehydrogenase
MSRRRLGVGLIGAGGIARFAHFPNLARNPRVQLVAVADVDGSKARQAAEDYGIPHSYDNFSELVDDEAVEAAIITTPPTAHAEPVIAAARAGKHVLCEKPIASTLEDADAMVDAAEKAGVKFAMGYQHRFGAGLPMLKKLLGEGLVGRVMGVTHVEVAPSRHEVPWFLQRRHSGGGVFMDKGIYTAHTLLWLFGPVESVYASTAIFRPTVQVGEQLVEDVDVEDTAMATIRFRNGAMGSWYAAWAVAARHQSMTIDGPDGSIIVRGERPSIEVFSKASAMRDHLHGWLRLDLTEPSLMDLHYRKLADLVNAVLDGKPVQVTGADGRDALELVIATYRSAETRCPTRLPLDRSKNM